jgi:hypothetical protein
MAIASTVQGRQALSAREGLYRLLIAIHLAQGNRVQAIQAYRRLAKSLWDDYQVRPSRQLEHMVRGTPIPADTQPEVRASAVPCAIQRTPDRRPVPLNEEVESRTIEVHASEPHEPGQRRALVAAAAVQRWETTEADGDLAELRVFVNHVEWLLGQLLTRAYSSLPKWRRTCARRGVAPRAICGSSRKHLPRQSVASVSVEKNLEPEAVARIFERVNRGGNTSAPST